MPSRKAERKAKSDAAKRAPAQARAAGAAGTAGTSEAAGAAAALADVNVNPLGGRSTLEHPDMRYNAVECEALKEMAGDGDMDAQFSFGYLLTNGWFDNYPSANEVGFRE
jgi:hypothetical protein